jgi:hypothetical protein
MSSAAYSGFRPADADKVADGSDTSSLVLCAVDRHVRRRFAELGATNVARRVPKREVIASLVAVFRPGCVR